MYINDTALDAALTQIKESTRLMLCSSEPASYSAANTAMLAHKDTPTFSANEDGTSGRQFRVSAVTDGTGDATGTASHWALVDVADTTLWAVGDLSDDVSIASGSTVSIGEITVRLNDPS